MKIANYLKQAYCKHLIKDNLNYFFREMKIMNDLDRYPLIEDIIIEDWGFRTSINISGICSYNDLEIKVDYLKQLFRAIEIITSNKRGKANIEIILESPVDIEYTPCILPSTQLLVGYDNRSRPIVVDMLKTPHIGIQGLSNNGKSVMVELILRNLINADIILLNTFNNDFKSIKCRRINGNNNILEYLLSLLEEPLEYEKPLYIVIDELTVLNNNKDISKAIMNLLGQARHYNIYIIGIGQTLLKESCSYKQLFNTRITFRMIDKSTISSFLGCTIEDTELQQREFIMYSDGIYRGKTYLNTNWNI